MEAIAAVSDPRSSFYRVMRRENLPANELMGRRMESGVLAVLGQLNATRNWNRIGREWWFADPPATELGEQERAWARVSRASPPYRRPASSRIICSTELTISTRRIEAAAAADEPVRADGGVDHSRPHADEENPDQEAEDPAEEAERDPGRAPLVAHLLHEQDACEEQHHGGGRVEPIADAHRAAVELDRRGTSSARAYMRPRMWIARPPPTQTTAHRMWTVSHSSYTWPR